MICEEVPGFENSSDLITLVRRSALAALEAEHTEGPDSVTLLLSDDNTLRDLNRRFNDEDSVTDVLSFNEIEGWRNGTPPPELTISGFSMPGDKPALGEIVISLEQTRRQAEERSVDFEREMAMLTVHGILHLLGYDHADQEEERIMFGKTDTILETVFKD